MKKQSNLWLGIAIITGLASMAGAIFALMRTDKGKKLGQNATKYAGRATELASDYVETTRRGKKNDSGDFAQYLFETWGRVKSHGREIDYIDVQLEDGSNYRLRADKLDESTKRELIGRGELQ